MPEDALIMFGRRERGARENRAIHPLEVQRLLCHELISFGFVPVECGRYRVCATRRPT